MRNYHGETKTRLHRIWMQMRGRCNSATNPSYRNYGGRGIKVCEEWGNYSVFATWARNNGYDSKLTIDRIDNDGNYEPTNCRWVDRKVQCNNKRNNRRITYNGETHTVEEWNARMGLPKGTIRRRLHDGWSSDEAISTPAKTQPPKKFITFQNETRTLSEWAREVGIGVTTIAYRLQNGWSVDEALTMPPDPTNRPALATKEKNNG